MSRLRRKIYYVIRNCENILQSLQVQGFESILFTAWLFRNGKKCNSIDKANTKYFGELMRNYDKSEEPDKMKIEFRHSNNDSLLWSKEFSLSDTSVEPTTAQPSFQGLGQVEVNEIIGRKIADYEQAKEMEHLRSELEELSAENEELKGALEESTDQLNAKKQVEYYANILGMAMPGLAKMMGKSQAGNALGFLAGTEEEQDEGKPAPTPNGNSKRTGDNHAIIEMVTEYMQSLDEPHLEKFYAVVCEFSHHNNQENKK